MACASSIKDAMRLPRRRKCYLVVGKVPYITHVKISQNEARWLLSRGVFPNNSTKMCAAGDIVTRPAFAYGLSESDNLATSDLLIYEN